jgi:hypothetical protein
MHWGVAGGIGAAASLALGVAGFQLCRWKLPKNRGSFIDGGGIVAVLFGYPVGSFIGAVLGLLGARILGGSYSPIPGLLLGFLPLLVPAAWFFLHMTRRR